LLIIQLGKTPSSDPILFERAAQCYYFYISRRANQSRIATAFAAKLAAQSRHRKKTMRLIADTPMQAATNTAPAANGDPGISPAFRFIPHELVIKCRALIESYHAVYGYVGLPDMLWLSDARDIIESHNDLSRAFTRAAKSRGAKRANDSFLLIATTIVSLEILARDFSGWGKRFPAAKHQAETMLGDLLQLRRTWLMDLYLFPPLGVGHEPAGASPPSPAALTSNSKARAGCG
jgi:hypothetical protein